jgi:hypothetical protein
MVYQLVEKSRVGKGCKKYNDADCHVEFIAKVHRHQHQQLQTAIESEKHQIAFDCHGEQRP